MIGPLIGFVGFLLRSAGYLLAGALLLMGVLRVAGVENDETIDGPRFIVLGLGLLAIVFAFSMRKRWAKKRAAAKRTDSSPQTVRVAKSTIKNDSETKLVEHIDAIGATGPARRAASMELEKRRIWEGAEKGASSKKSAMGWTLRILGYFYGVMFVLYGLGQMAGLELVELDEGEEMHNATSPIMLIVGVILLLVTRRISSRAKAAS